MNKSELLFALLDRLWGIYCGRVEYARRYVEMVKAKGGRPVNDHIAFRTFNAKTGSQPAGIAAIERVLIPLGYEPRDGYEFTDKHLTARHYEHPAPTAPKIFISQLEVDRLPGEAAELIRQAVADANDRFEPALAWQLGEPDRMALDAAANAVDRLVGYFTTLPWSPPRVDAVRKINAASQYAAWTLLHGNNVNHFTAYVNEQGVKEWPDIEATAEALRAAGIPMKKEYEGARGSKLRQTATAAVEIDCDARDEAGKPTKLRWSYAYYELAERGDVVDASGKKARFQGFLGPQAAQLFEMTKR